MYASTFQIGDSDSDNDENMSCLVCADEGDIQPHRYEPEGDDEQVSLEVKGDLLNKLNGYICPVSAWICSCWLRAKGPMDLWHHSAYTECH